MKISIVTPNYNYGKYLPACLESVWDQVKALEPESTLTVEHIVVDGASSDDSKGVLSRWGAEHPPTIRYGFRWASERDAGQTDAINKGLRQAQGDIVCWLNSDEMYLPGGLMAIQRSFEQNPNVDLVYGEALYLTVDGKSVKKWGHSFSPGILIHYGCVIPSCAAFWRRKILDNGVYLDPSYRVIMDGEYWCRLIQMGYIFKFIPVRISSFLWHGDNVSSSNPELGLREKARILEHYAIVPSLFARNPSHYHRVMYFWFHQYRRLLVVFRLLFGAR